MDNIELTRLERMARLMPPQSMNFGRTESIFGPLYIAWGQRGPVWHGIWGLRAVAQPMEFIPDTDEATVKHVLIHTAMKFVADMDTVKLLENPAHFNA